MYLPRQKDYKHGVGRMARAGKLMGSGCIGVGGVEVTNMASRGLDTHSVTSYQPLCTYLT